MFRTTVVQFVSGLSDLPPSQWVIYRENGWQRNKTRAVEISQRLADAINARRKRLGAGPNDLLFPNRTNPDQHLLRELQTLGKRAGAQFAVGRHKRERRGRASTTLPPCR